MKPNWFTRWLFKRVDFTFSRSVYGWEMEMMDGRITIYGAEVVIPQTMTVMSLNTVVIA